MAGVSMGIAPDFNGASTDKAPLSLDGLGTPQGPSDQAPDALNPLDSEDSRQVLSQIESWYAEQVDLHADSRREQLIDCDFYDREQYDPETKAILLARNQAPLVFDLIHPIVDWLVGTERRTRVDWAVHPRNDEDVAPAEAKEKVLKFVDDTSEASFERSKAFKDAAISGVGWTREFAQSEARDGPPVSIKHVNWKAVRWDPYSRADDLSDCRSITIEHFIDLDYVLAMFPNRIENLKSAASGMIDPSLELLQDDMMVPGLFAGLRPGVASGAHTTARMRNMRSRVRLLETEYRRPLVERRIKALMAGYDDVVGRLYDPQDAAMTDLITRQRVTVEDRMTDTIWLAIWHPGFFCANMRMPYKHNRFSLTPTWAFRRHRDGMPYGVVRGLRDPQDEYNKRRSKALFALSTNRVLYEEDAIAEGSDEEEVLAEAAKPNGQVKLAAGALQNGKFKIESNTDVGESHVKLMESTRQFMFEGSGVTRENLGLNSSAQSGRAILAKQQQGSVSTAELFDNERRSLQWSGRKTLSLIEQYMTLPMQLRITGPDGAEQWLAINNPQYDPVTGKVIFENDLTAQESKFVVDQQDFRETVRMAMAEMLMETISKMPPELGIQLLDLAVDLTDIPNKDEIVQRIRKMNGANPQPPDPAQAAAQQAAQQQAEEDRQAKLAATQAKAQRDAAAASKMNAETQNIGVQTKAKALDTAGLLSNMLPLPPAADRLASLPPLPAPQLTPPVKIPAQPNGYPAT